MKLMHLVVRLSVMRIRGNEHNCHENNFKMHLILMLLYIGYIVLCKFGGKIGL